MSSRIRATGVALVSAALLITTTAVPRAQGPDLPALLKTYRTGDADAAVRALASWPPTQIAHSDAHLDVSDSWGRLALGVLMEEASWVRLYALPLDPALPTDDRAIAEIRVACLLSTNDARLHVACRDAARALVMFMRQHFADRAGPLVEAFADDPVVQLAIGTGLEFGMLEVEGKGGHGLSISSQALSVVTSHGRVGLPESKGAEAAYRRALALDPTLTEARVRLGRVLWMLDRNQQAEEAWRAVLTDSRADPDSAYLAGLFLGQLLEHEHRPADAEDAYRKALSVEPSGQSVRAALARLLFTSGRESDGWAVLTEGAAHRAAAPDPWTLYPVGAMWWHHDAVLRALRAQVRP